MVTATSRNHNVARLAFRKDAPSRPGDPLTAAGLDARLVWVTPALASEWLGANTRNRKKKVKKIEQYGRDMGRGKWPVTGQTIIFDWNGVLVDGQNRLQACVDSGASFRTIVVWGVDPEAFRHIDRGTPRSFADALGIDGEINNKTLSSVIPYLFRWERGLSITHGNGAPTMDEAYDILARYPEIRDSLRWQHPPREIAIVPSVGVFMHFQLSRLDETRAETFFSLLYPGDGLPAGHAIGTLRKQLVKYRVALAGATPSNLKVIAWTYRSWNHWVNGQKVSTIKWTPDMDFPVPLAPRATEP